ncbi:MAG: tyrosine--tRNA ligase [Candidatus Bathyarchaeota archaeon]|nr:tyrosine--tRNA ligase [Candidatus Bathyarchaeota archaeon A05DMB-3]MDH7607516.1 tyrosine--tRNA ligase [Candidatus Bathyarchaeota archaeon]
MDIETKIDLIKKPPTEEILVESELRELLETNPHPGHYIGFETSGLLHLGNLVMSGFKINDFLKAGIRCQVYLADWHSFINNKFGGDWEKIGQAAKYYAKAFQFFCPDVKIVVGSELYHNNDEYWRNLLKFAKHMTLSRTLRCLTIMGRSETERLDLSQYFYPPMQAVDIKTIGADIPHGGMDQRKAHVLAREIFPKMGWRKPVAVHHHLLMGIAEPVKIEAKDKLEQVIASKMSKSKPWTAIFIHDTEEQIKAKLKKAWCPEKQTEMNPVLEIAKHVIFHENETFTVERPSKFGGTTTFENYTELEKAYRSGQLHPQDLKNAVAKELAKILEPIRKFFEKDKEARENLETVKKAQVTR